MYRRPFIENIQGVKSGNNLKEKSGWPTALSITAKRHDSNGYTVLKAMSVFSNFIANLIVLHA